MLKRPGFGDSKNEKISPSSVPTPISSSDISHSSSYSSEVTRSGNRPIMKAPSSSSSSGDNAQTRISPFYGSLAEEAAQMRCKPSRMMSVQKSPEEIARLNEELVLAVGVGADIGEIKELVQAGADIRSRDPNGRTLFYMAAYDNYVHILQYFYELRNQPGQPDITKDSSGLNAAITNNSFEAIQCLESHGENLNSISQDDLNMLANIGAKKTLDFLRRKINNPALRVPRAKYVPLFANELFDALISGRTEKMEVYIKQGADVHNMKCGPRRSPLLIVAAGLGEIAIVKWLIYTHHVNPLTEDEDERDILFHATANKKLEVLRFCKKIPRLDPNRCDKWGMTPLAYAALNKQLEEVQCLVEELGASVEKSIPPEVFKKLAQPEYDRIRVYLVTAKDIQKKTSENLYEVLRSGRCEDIMTFISERKINVHRSLFSPTLNTLIFLVAERGRADIAQWLVEVKQVDPTEKNDKNENILFIAARNGNVKFLHWCKQFSQLDPSLRNDAGESPFFAAARNRHVDVLKCLVEEFGINVRKNLPNDLSALKGDEFAETIQYIGLKARSQSSVAVVATARESSSQASSSSNSDHSLLRPLHHRQTSNVSTTTIASGSASVESMTTSARMIVPKKSLPAIPRRKSPEEISRLNEELITAVQEGAAIEEILEILQEGADIRCRTKEGENIFFVATGFNHVHLMQFFFELKSQPGTPDFTNEILNGQMSALDLAVGMNLLDAVKWFEAHGVDLNSVSQLSLDAVANMGGRRTLNYLRDKITNSALSVPLPKLRSPQVIQLYNAIVSGDAQEMEKSIQQGIDVHHTLIGIGRPVLLTAASSGHLHLVKLLIDTYHVDITTMDADGLDILLTAAFGGSLEILRFCKRFFPRLNPNKPYKDNIYLLSHLMISIKPKLAVIKCLVEELGANVEKSMSPSVFEKLSSPENAEVRNYLIIAKRTQQDAGKRLFEAMANDHFEDLKALIQQGVDVHRTLCDPELDTPILSAAEMGKTNIVKWLVEVHHVDPTVKNDRNEDILFIAARTGDLELLRWCKSFPQLSVSTSLRNDSDESPFYVAARNRHVEILRCLVEEFRVNVVQSMSITQLKNLKGIEYKETIEFIVAVGKVERARVVGGVPYSTPKETRNAVVPPDTTPVPVQRPSSPTSLMRLNHINKAQNASVSQSSSTIVASTTTYTSLLPKIAIGRRPTLQASAASSSISATDAGFEERQSSFRVSPPRLRANTSIPTPSSSSSSVQYPTSPPSSPPRLRVNTSIPTPSSSSSSVQYPTSPPSSPPRLRVNTALSSLSSNSSSVQHPTSPPPSPPRMRMNTSLSTFTSSSSSLQQPSSTISQHRQLGRHQGSTTLTSSSTNSQLEQHSPSQPRDFSFRLLSRNAASSTVVSTLNSSEQGKNPSQQL